MTRFDVAFESGEITLAGHLYLPDTPADAPRSSSATPAAG
jgi:hypothetical protein